jgi:hypothetical protein
MVMRAENAGVKVVKQSDQTVITLADAWDDKLKVIVNADGGWSFSCQFAGSSSTVCPYPEDVQKMLKAVAEALNLYAAESEA